MLRLCHRSVLVGVLAAAGLAAAPAAAAPSFGPEDLKGEYFFTVHEVQRGAPLASGVGFGPPNQCVIAGTAIFDGAGRMTLEATQRCHLTGTGPIGGTQFYTVNPDGSFLISERADMSDPVHGQIVDKGRSLLLDGTTRTLAETFSWIGVAMKR